MKEYWNKEVVGWSMYDFANTIFSAMFITVYFPLLVTLRGGTAFHVGLIMSSSMLLAGLLVPFLGALADITRRKKLFLFIFTVLCCLFTFFTGFFSFKLMLVFGLLANLFYRASLDVYDSLLVNISSPRNIGKISGLGTAAGYAGAVFSAVIAYGIGFLYGYENIPAVTIVFMIVPFLYFGFSLFTFILVKEKQGERIRREYFTKAFHNTIFTLRNIQKFKSIWLFLLASFLYVDAASTAIVFLFLYARDQLGLGLAQFLPLYMVMAIAAGIGSLIFGTITDKIGHKKTLLTVLFLWMILILLLYLKTTLMIFILVGILGGALLGAVWTITRPLLIELAPKKKVAELLGYQGLTEKFSGVLGPFLFGSLAVAAGFRAALWVIIIFFLLGAFVLNLVKKEQL